MQIYIPCTTSGETYEQSHDWIDWFSSAYRNEAKKEQEPRVADCKVTELSVQVAFIFLSYLFILTSVALTLIGCFQT